MGNERPAAFWPDGTVHKIKNWNSMRSMGWKINKDQASGMTCQGLASQHGQKKEETHSNSLWHVGSSGGLFDAETIIIVLGNRRSLIRHIGLDKC